MKVLYLLRYLYCLGDGLLLVLSLLLVNVFAFGSNQFPDVDLFDSSGWKTAGACFYGILIMLLLLIQGDMYKGYWNALSRNWLLIIFLLYSLSSIFWTIYLQATLFELIFLFFSTFVGIYFSIRYRTLGVINLITIIAVVSTLASLYLVLFTRYGVMPNEPFVGSWDGLFWHRNHTGSLMAFFNMVFLVRLLMEKSLSKVHKLIFSLFYFFTVVHVFGSRSATGVIIFCLLNFSTLIGYIWLTWGRNLKMWHYYSFAISMLTLFIIFVLNLDFFFGLLGRSSTMTGRTPLWNDLLRNFYLSSPIFGHGFGAIWMQENFRLLMQNRQGWLYPVYFSDNGFLDILLNLGGIGLILFLMLFILTGIRSVRRLLSIRSWMNVFLILVLLYIFSANLTYSFLFEVDYFVWMILVMLLTLVSTSETEQE